MLHAYSLRCRKDKFDSFIDYFSSTFKFWEDENLKDAILAFKNIIS